MFSRMGHCYELTLSMVTIHWKSYLMSNDSHTIIGAFIGSEMVCSKLSFTDEKYFSPGMPFNDPQ